jgi:long-chain acyl-CoA synthetase
VFDHASELADLIRGRGVHLGVLPAALAARYGEREAVSDDAPTPGLHTGGARSYDDLERHTGLLAAALAHAGVGGGRRVLVLLDNRIDIALSVFALARLGAIAVPVNARLTAHEVRGVADAAGADLALADAGPAARALEVGLEVVAVDEVGAVLAGGGLAPLPPVGRDVDAPAVMLATSGTSGAPKAAVLTSRGLLAATGRLLAAPVGARRHWPRAGRDRVLAALPLTHVMGLQVLVGALCAGVPLLHRRRFHADEVLDLIEHERPNVFLGVPTMYADLEAAGAAERDLTSVQLWGSSADAMPTERARRFQGYGRAIAGRLGTAVFVDIYGMVELSGPAAVRVYPPSPVGTLSLPVVGVVLPGLDVRTVDGDGGPVGTGEVGHLQFRGAGVLTGYEGRDDAGPDADGWFDTGDHGRLWPGGVFSLAGRARDRLKVGGFSVFPAEIEAELASAPGVAEVAVVGLPDDRLGERPVALVVPTDDFDAAAFLAYAEREVAGYRRPREVVMVERIPRGNHGKIDRDRATQLAVARLAPA